MQRIRTIKPEIRISQSLGNVCREARYLFMLMITFSDDEGRMPGNHRFLAHELYAYDIDVTEKNVADWCRELEREGCIQQYRVDRADYVLVSNFAKHQRIDHPRPSKLPPPPKVMQEELAFDPVSDADQGAKGPVTKLLKSCG